MSSSKRGVWRRMAAATVLAAILVGGGVAPAVADDYEPKRSGHPMRLIAYLMHPIGVFFDYVFMRPAHWIGHSESAAKVFGHEDY